MLRRLTHPQVVRLVDFLEASEHGPLLVMELGHGVDLARLFGQDRASVSHAARVAQQLLDILAALGIVSPAERNQAARANPVRAAAPAAARARLRGQAGQAAR